MRNFVQPGDTVTVPAPSGGVTSGDGVLVGSLFGVAAYSAAEGGEVEITTVGVFDLKKAAGATFTIGAKAYYDATAKAVSATASGNKLIGAALRDANSSAPTARVRLDGGTV